MLCVYALLNFETMLWVLIDDLSISVSDSGNEFYFFFNQSIVV